MVNELNRRSVKSVLGTIAKWARWCVLMATVDITEDGEFWETGEPRPGACCSVTTMYVLPLYLCRVSMLAW